MCGLTVRQTMLLVSKELHRIFQWPVTKDLILPTFSCSFTHRTLCQDH